MKKPVEKMNAEIHDAEAVLGYQEPVAQLLALGDIRKLQQPYDYLALGLTPADVPELIRVLCDDVLYWSDSEEERWAALHAAHALGQLVNLLFGIFDQLVCPGRRGLRIDGHDLHPDQTFGWIMRNQDKALVERVSLFKGGVGFKPLQRVDVRVLEMGAKAQILVQTQHRLTRLQVSLDRVRILR